VSLPAGHRLGAYEIVAPVGAARIARRGKAMKDHNFAAPAFAGQGMVPWTSQIDQPSRS
jgi:hypothetical protein